MRLFILKPDGIGDFILVTGALRLLASELGEENLLICVRSVIVPLAKAAISEGEGSRATDGGGAKKDQSVRSQSVLLPAALVQTKDDTLLMLRSAFEA